jgi:hypothetical protein
MTTATVSHTRTGPPRTGFRRWTPYLAGIGIGVLSWIAFAGMGKALGTSTTFAKLAGAGTGVVAADHVNANAYYGKYFNPDKGRVMFDWQFFLVVGLPIGAWIGSRLLESKPHFAESVPPLWEQRFGKSRALRYGAAFLGGAVMLYGARMAGGCTSGHGISGGLQLALSSWAFFVAMFLAGVAAAFALFGVKGREHV